MLPGPLWPVALTGHDGYGLPADPGALTNVRGYVGLQVLLLVMAAWRSWGTRAAGRPDVA